MSNMSDFNINDWVMDEECVDEKGRRFYKMSYKPEVEGRFYNVNFYSPVEAYFEVWAILNDGKNVFLDGGLSWKEAQEYKDEEF